MRTQLAGIFLQFHYNAVIVSLKVSFPMNKITILRDKPYLPARVRTEAFVLHYRKSFFMNRKCKEITIYAPVNIVAPCIIFSGGQIHYEGG